MTDNKLDIKTYSLAEVAELALPLAEVTIDPVAATVRTRARDGHTDAAAIAERSVRRFAAAVLGITV